MKNTLFFFTLFIILAAFNKNRIQANCVRTFQYKNVNQINGCSTILLKEINSQKVGDNTIYIIQNDIDLDGAGINDTTPLILPLKSVIIFQGGSIKNGKIIGQNTRIIADRLKIFSSDVILEGTWDVSEAYPEWFGAVGDGKSDDTNAVQKVFDSFLNVCITNTYMVASTLYFRGNLLKGLSQKKSVIKAKPALTSELIRFIGTKGTKVSDISFYGSGASKTCVFDNIDNSDDLRPVSIIESCNFMNFKGNGLVVQSTNTLINNCIFSNNNGNGLYLANVSNSVINSISYFNRLSGFYAKTGTNKFCNCKAYYNGRIYKEYPDSIDVGAGFRVGDGGRAVSFVNCETQQNYKHGFYIYGNLCNITNCQCIADNLINDLNGAAFYLRGNGNNITGTVEVSARETGWESHYSTVLYVDNSRTNNYINVEVNNSIPENGFDLVKGTYTYNDGLIFFNGIRWNSVGTPDERSECIRVNGFIYYDTTIAKPTFWNEERMKWLEADGAKAGVLRSGIFAERPSTEDIYIGFQYFDTNRNIMITYGGEGKWYNSDGTEATQ